MQPTYRAKDIVSGLLLIAIGSFFAFSARNLNISSVRNMGAGYFPLILSALLVFLGIIVIVISLRSSNDETRTGFGTTPWRGVVLLSAALLFFAWLVKPLGLGPALAGAVAISSLASQRWRLVPTLVSTVAMVACGWLVFIKLLGMPVPFLGPWFR